MAMYVYYVHIATELALIIYKSILDSDQSVEAHSGASSGHESNASDGE